MLAQQSHCAEPDCLLGEPETREGAWQRLRASSPALGPGELGAVGPQHPRPGPRDGAPGRTRASAVERGERGEAVRSIRGRKGRAAHEKQRSPPTWPKARSTRDDLRRKSVFSDLNPGRSRGQGWVGGSRVHACVHPCECVCTHTCGCQQPHKKSGREREEERTHPQGQACFLSCLTHRGDRLCLFRQTFSASCQSARRVAQCA